MSRAPNRRDFLGASAALAAGLALPPLRGRCGDAPLPFSISLAEWSFHRALMSGRMTNLDFPLRARELGFRGVEYVNVFFDDHVKDLGYLGELRRRCDHVGVRSLLIMCDGLGALGAPEPTARRRAVEAHRPWLEAASFLGCHSIRVNARSSGTWEEQRDRAAEGLHALALLADPFDLHVLVENHGGLSSNGRWLAETLAAADHPRVGALPDFGNFHVGPDEEYDRYRGVAELMPFARAVSAKSYDFDAEGWETTLDYPRLLGIVLDAGYRGWIGVEYEGGRLPEEEGIRATKALLERVGRAWAAAHPAPRQRPLEEPGGR